MRILLYSYELHPLGGGVGKAIKEILDRYGNETDLKVDFITTSLSGKLEVSEYSHNITMHRVPISKRKKEDYHRQRPWQMMLYTLVAYFYTWKLIFKEKYDLAHFFGYPGGVVTMLFAWKQPYIVSLRGVDVPGYNEKFKRYYLVFKPLSRLVWKISKRVIANSQALAKLANETMPALDIKIIPNGIDSTRFLPKGEGIKHDEFSVTASGTLLGKRKGLMYLVEGFAKFAKEKQHGKLVLYADGDREDFLKGLATELGVSGRVDFRGRTPNEVIREELPSYYAYCLPSFNEGMANTTLEAIAAGLPIIITDTGGTAELLREGENGFLIDVANSEQIYESLCKLYDNPELRIKMGKNSREIAEKLSWENVAKAYVEEYKLVMAKK